MTTTTIRAELADNLARGEITPADFAALSRLANAARMASQWQAFAVCSWVRTGPKQHETHRIWKPRPELAALLAV